MTCIYKKSKYYAKAKLNPWDIVEPIGDSFLAESKKVVLKRVYGQSKNKFLVDKAIIRHISSLRTYANDIPKFLKQSDSNRKNYYMNGLNLEALSKDNTNEMINELRNNFFKDSGKQQLIQFLQLIMCIQSYDSFFSIRDYALSTYFAYYHGQNPIFYKHLEKHLQSQFLEYQNEILINSPKLSRPQIRKISNYENLPYIEDYIKEINQIGREKDQFYNGVHIYINDLIPQSNKMSFAQQQKDFLPYLQFNVLLIMSILGEGQHAILRTRGTFTHKTSEYIFLLKTAFTRVNFHKNIISNPFSHDKYVICQYFHKQNGAKIAQYLIKNYHLLFQPEEKLLVDPKATFANDFQKNITLYNDYTPIFKYCKELMPEFIANSNINIYPNKEALFKRVEELKLDKLVEICQQLEDIIPNEGKAKQESKPQKIIEKKGVALDLQIFKPIVTKPLKTNSVYDISQKKQNDQFQKYIQRGNKQIEEKKKKEKQKSKKKKDN